MTASIPPTAKHGAPPDPLAHRYLLGRPLDYQPFAGSDLFARIGGQATVDRLVDHLYDGFETDPGLRPLFGRDLTGDRARQKMFFAQWLGGSHRYAERSYSGLVHRHESVPVTRALAGRWLHHFRQALTRTVAAETDRKAIFEQARTLALALVNEENAPAVGQPAAGAHEDVFTAAFLGHLTQLRAFLAADTGLVHACDPASDVLEITPIDHAVAGGQAEALRRLLDHVRPPLRGSGRALRGAVERGDVPMAEMLLSHGADPATIGVGRWVLHPELAPLLASRGASIGCSGAWIGACCTGNQGRKDDPEYVRALLRHGARANDRRTGDGGPATGVRVLAATGLHYAAKAGFVQTVQVLLEHGADPRARDSQGRTPLDWLEEGAPSPARDQIRRLLAATRPAHI
jgi:truncated hemoglobin YjbI